MKRFWKIVKVRCTPTRVFSSNRANQEGGGGGGGSNSLSRILVYRCVQIYSTLAAVSVVFKIDERWAFGSMKVQLCHHSLWYWVASGESDLIRRPGSCIKSTINELGGNWGWPSWTNKTNKWELYSPVQDQFSVCVCVCACACVCVRVYGRGDE